MEEIAKILSFKRTVLTILKHTLNNCDLTKYCNMNLIFIIFRVRIVT